MVSWECVDKVRCVTSEKYFWTCCSYKRPPLVRFRPSPPPLAEWRRTDGAVTKGEAWKAKQSGSWKQSSTARGRMKLCSLEQGCGLGMEGGVSLGWGRDLNTQQLIGKDVPEDGKKEEGDEGEDKDPPGALFVEGLLVASQNQQAHTDAHHRPRQVGHEAGLRPGRWQRWWESKPHCPSHLRTHYRTERGRWERCPGCHQPSGRSLHKDLYSCIWLLLEKQNVSLHVFLFVNNLMSLNVKNVCVSN